MKTTEDKRQCNRVRYDGSFRYVVSVPDYLTTRLVEAEGIGIDICEHGRGIGFHTDFPLEPGHVLRLRKTEEVYTPAVVKWVERAEEKHRVGIYLFS
ncbi:MAG: PilZ domain-containing protein [Nitrospirae bacterium]|nr:PilZ domain-containing protein [Nitrospirota bacterium]